MRKIKKRKVLTKEVIKQQKETEEKLKRIKDLEGKSINLDFNFFHESYFVKEEDFEIETAFILENGMFVNGKIKCESKTITTSIYEPIDSKAHGYKIKFYMIKD